jgi:phospho-N-acetylmuramoyl-pentapeptide-transferase
MLYYLHLLTDCLSPLRVFQYITFRAFAGAGTAFIIALISGPPIIRFLRYLKVSQSSRMDDVPDLYKFHARKEGTPIMGGLIIIFSVLLSTLLWAQPTSGYILISIATFCFMGAIGFVDDFRKIRNKKSKGLGAKGKLILQLCWAILLVIILWNWAPTKETIRQLMVPFMKNPLVSDMGMILTMLFITLVVVGSTNAVNLTDGLDGLAVGCSNSVALAYLIMAYVAGHVQFSSYLNVPYMAGSGELAVFCGCLLGGGLGFLWYNCHPARVFMGDTGSLALGGAIAIVAILICQELTLIIVGGVFVIEAISVLIQVVYFKITSKRVFKCAPIHHHFELLEKENAENEGRDVEVVETMITIRFWIISILFALLGVATLKIR